MLSKYALLIAVNLALPMLAYNAHALTIDRGPILENDNTRYQSDITFTVSQVAIEPTHIFLGSKYYDLTSASGKVFANITGFNEDEGITIKVINATLNDVKFTILGKVQRVEIDGIFYDLGNRWRYILNDTATEIDLNSSKDVFSVVGGDFALSALPSSRTVSEGQSASYQIEATLLSGTAQPVSLSISGLPAGATATFTPNSITPTGTSTLFVTTSNTTPPGTYTLLITATGPSGVIRTATVNLIVAPITVQSFMTDSSFAQISSIDSIFTLDKTTSTLKLLATNPGTYFYNKIIINTGTTPITVSTTISIPASVSPPGPALPQAFCLKGSVPIQVFSDRARTADATSQSTISLSQPIGGATSQSLTCVSSVSVTSTIPSGALRYITMHLDFNAKGSTGFPSDAASTYKQGFKFTETDAITGITGTIQDLTTFTAVGKTVTAIGGFALDSNGIFKSGLSVKVFSGAALIGTSSVMPPDGFYFETVPAGGPYTVKLFNPTGEVPGTAVGSVSVLQGQYVEIDFLNLNPADPSISGYVFDSSTNGVPNVTVNLYKVANTQSKLMGSTTTGVSGFYAFRFTQPGDYTVEILVPQGYTADKTSMTMSVKQFENLRIDFNLKRS